DVNDHAPECEPPFQELTIHTHLGRSMEVTRMSCRVPQEPQRLAFSYSIVGGNSRSQFSLQGAVLVHNNLMLGPSWPEQPHTYELLIRVADAGPSTPHLSTTATVIVHLVPWRASTVATSTHKATVRGSSGPWWVGRKGLGGCRDLVFQVEQWGKAFRRELLSAKSLAIRKRNLGCGVAQPLEGFEGWMIRAFWQGIGEAVAPFQGTSMMTPLLVTDTEAFWQPEPWFVVVLTVTSALLLLALGWLLSRLLRGLAQVLQAPSKPTQALLLNSIQGTEGSVEGFMEAPRMETPQAPSSVISLQHFDGRAQDPCTGRDYLFNTHTGARRWL
ncbi:cadherin-related family member 4-like, partial [Physeter macrocephalus]|uniref:Cadherin-related family member 4-like n=1 Tax=Physeter macrocephalus TaxID=9755 RepID=A0A455B2K2_PHYMC